jgi:methionine aminopeptidase
LLLLAEPMLNEGSAEIEMLDDGWTFITKSVAVAVAKRTARRRMMSSRRRRDRSSIRSSSSCSIRLCLPSSVLCVRCRDGGRSAQYEETILITSDGHEILTQHDRLV